MTGGSPSFDRSRFMVAFTVVVNEPARETA